MAQISDSAAIVFTRFL